MARIRPMKTTVSISLEEDLLAEIDRLARSERRSRSALLQEAVRLYLRRRDRWNKIFAWGKAAAKSKGLSERDIAEEIQAHRRKRRVGSRSKCGQSSTLAGIRVYRAGGKEDNG
ncbi:MAG: ribbon-helix-helix protein, CopG family [Planctomycetes bacterium]|nr:ribbon-helix-helix protein, CopG family [Planctomycetota bacterium]